MGVLIGPIEFEGPFSDFSQLKDSSGIFAILTQLGEDFELVELDDSNCVRDSLMDSEFTSNLRFLQDTAKSTLFTAVHYTPKLSHEDRRQVCIELLREFED